MVEHGIRPQHGIVAGFAGCGERRRGVVHRANRIVVIGLVTRNTRRIRDRVVVIHVAIRALPRRHSVRSR